MQKEGLRSRYNALVRSGFISTESIVPPQSPLRVTAIIAGYLLRMRNFPIINQDQ
jgi:hypothetical protein